MIYIRTDSKYGDLEYRNSDYAIMKKKKKGNILIKFFLFF